MWLKFLHTIGLTNLSNEQVSRFTENTRNAAIEIAKLTPTQRNIYETEKNSSLHEEISLLKSENSRLIQMNKSARVIGTVTVIFMGIGSGLISSFADGNNPFCFGIGWGLIIVAGVFQLINSYFNI